MLGARATAAFALCAVVLLVLSSAAAARPKPHVALTVPSEVDVGAPLLIQWRATGVPKGGRVVIQRPVGTGQVWKSLGASRVGTSGTATVPAYAALGVYRIRIAVTGFGKMLASQVQQVHVFGPIPFTSLLAPYSGGLPTGVHATPTASFAFATRIFEVEGPKQGVISDGSNQCNFVHVEFVGGKIGFAAAGAQVTATIVQERATPVSATAPEEQVGVVEARVVPGQTWAVNTNQSGAKELDLFFNGYARCDSYAKVSTLT